MPSDIEFEILTILFVNGTVMTAEEIAAQISTDVSSVQRELDKLALTNVITQTADGYQY